MITWWWLKSNPHLALTGHPKATVASWRSIKPKSSNKNWEEGWPWSEEEMKTEKAAGGIHGLRSNGSGPKKVRRSYTKENKAAALTLGCRKAARLHHSNPTCNLWVITFPGRKVLLASLRPLRRRHPCSKAICAEGTNLWRGWGGFMALQGPQKVQSWCNFSDSPAIPLFLSESNRI